VGVDSDAEVQPNSDDEDPVEEKTEVKGGEIEASKRSSPSPVLGSDGEKDEDSGGLVFLDVSLWKTEREALDDSFQSARAQFEKRGPWTLPSKLAPKKFHDVASNTLNKMSR
jgi:hypothetical protein